MHQPSRAAQRTLLARGASANSGVRPIQASGQARTSRNTLAMREPAEEQQGKPHAGGHRFGTAPGRVANGLHFGDTQYRSLGEL